MQKKPCIFPPKKLLYQILSLAAAALDIYRLEDGDYVFEQELGVVGSAVRGRWRIWR